jgi:methionine synthase I (cobalamin-dependent)
MSDSGRLAEALARGPILLDAAMGTRLIARGLDLSRDDPSLWCLDRPDEVLDIHRRDVAAGSDAILTNTFGANRQTLGRLGRGDDAAAINRRAVEIAREAAGPHRLVLGSIGPQAIYGPVGYSEQLLALCEAGVDALLLETFRSIDAKHVLGGLVGLAALIRVPILLSLTPPSRLIAKRSPRPDPFANSKHLASYRQYYSWGRAQGIEAFGCNCASLRGSLRYLERLENVTVPLLAKPSAGLPGGPMTNPEEFAEAVPRFLSAGVRLLGGCCGTTEAHIVAMRAALDEARCPSDAVTRRPPA